MKKTIVIYGFTLATMIFGPAIVGENNARSQAAAYVAAVAAFISVAPALFCPETPRQVCKSGSCMDGACISFRKHCSSANDCQPDPDSGATSGPKL